MFTNLQAQILPLGGPTTLNPVNSGCHFDDWTALKALYESTNGDNWKNRNGWDVIIDRHNMYPRGGDLSILEGVKLNALGRVVSVDLNFTQLDFNALTYCDLPSSGNGNNLRGTLPEELGLLTYLEFLDIGNNHITGNLPASLDLKHLEALYAKNNYLTGPIPEITALNCLDIAGNKFTCDEINQFLNFSTQDTEVVYSPQYFAHSYEPLIVDTNQTNNLLIFNQFLVGNGVSITQDSDYGWQKNGDWLLGSGAFQALTLLNIQPSDAGKYTFHLNDACGIGLDIISDPVYVIYPGYDFEGQPVEYNQIMVEFDRTEDTDFYETQILYPNGGSIVDQCNCNRELYLWQFPSDSAATVALLAIDASRQLEIMDDDDGEVDGGLNNILQRTVDPLQSPTTNFTYTIDDDIDWSIDYDDEVKVFILDTGVEENACTSDTFFYQNAPIDDCYSGETAIGYNYCNDNGIDNDFQDDQGHGTFGYDLITKGIEQADGIKIVPLKIFNEQGQASLFDLVCALYHAVDHGANIINVSAGYRGQASSILEKAIDFAREQEVFICTSAGDDYIDNDTLPQYPSNYAGMYHFEYGPYGGLVDSIRYSNVISIASLDPSDFLSDSSNFGSNSVTMACFGEDLISKTLNCEDAVGTGSSFSTFIVTRYLALEIAKDNTRDISTMWDDFQSSKLELTSYLTDKTITGKKLDINLNAIQLKTANNTNEFIDKKNNSDINSLIQSGEDFNAQIFNILNGNSYLCYTTGQSGGYMKIDLYDFNGCYITQIKDIYVDSIAEEQILLPVNSLQTGFYSISIKFLSDEGKQIHQVIQLPILK